MSDDSSKSVWDWLEDKGWFYLPLLSGYRSPCGKYFIAHTTIFAYPGDVINYLKTGFIRNVEIFDPLFGGYFDPKNLGLRVHKDRKTAVALRRVK